MTCTDVTTLPATPSVEDLFAMIDDVDMWDENRSDYHVDQEWQDAGTYE